MTMHKALHPKNDVDKLYVSIKEERRLASIQDSVNALIQKLEVYIKNAEEVWLQRPETIHPTQASTEQKRLGN